MIRLFLQGVPLFFGTPMKTQLQIPCQREKHKMETRARPRPDFLRPGAKEPAWHH